MIIFEVILLLVAMLALGYVQLHRWFTTGGVAVLLLLATFASSIPWWLSLIFWLIFLPLAIILNLQQLRQRFISIPLLHYVAKALPPMSRTEREALEAGDTWIEGDLFSGQFKWSKFLKKAKPTLTKEEQQFLDNQAQHLCEMSDDWQNYKDGDMPKAVWDYIKKEKFLGMLIPKKYGGLGFSAYAQSTILSTIATRSTSACVTVMVPNSLGPGELLVEYGTEEQKKKYLSDLATGKHIPCFALTGPEAGSDAGSIPDTGVVCMERLNGKDQIGIRLNFEKHYITLAPVATLVGLAFKLKDPNHLLGKEEEIGITVALLPADHPGVEIGSRHAPLNLPFMNGPIRGKDVFIPLDYIIGGQEMVGQGWRMLMECLSAGRGISLPGVATAGSQLSYRMTGAYAKLRKQFNVSIGRFEGVQQVMAEIAGLTYMIESSRALTASAVDEGIKPSLVSGIAKYHMTEYGRKVCLHAMDIHGGKAIQMGPKNYLGLFYQSVPIMITVEGANILVRNLLIFGQGAMRCHPFIRDEIDATQIKDQRQRIKIFDQILFSHMGYTLKNFCRTFLLGLSGGRIALNKQKKPIRRYVQHLTRMSSAFAFTADIALLFLGGDLKRKEALSARLGDVLSHLYLSAAVIKFYHDHGYQASDKSCVDWALQHNLHQIQQAFSDFCDNFPLRWVGYLLRFIIFPFGRHFHAPNDKLGQTIALQMMEPSELRDRLTSLVFIGDKHSATGIVEFAFKQYFDVIDIEDKVMRAVKDKQINASLNKLERMKAAKELKIINKKEYTALEAFYQALAEVVRVDEFDQKTMESVNESRLYN